MTHITYPVGPVEPGHCGWCGEHSGFFKNGKAKKWCSDYCGTSASSFRKTGRVAPMKQPSSRPTTCLGCGVALTNGPRTRNPKKWCSESCRAENYARVHPDRAARRKMVSAARAKKRAEAVEASKPPKPRCENCGTDLASRRAGIRFCSAPACQRAKRVADARVAPRCTVEGCERPQIARGMCGSHCALDWAKRNPERSAAGKARYRARKRDAFVEDVIPVEVFERDGWRCGICGERIPKGARYPDPRSASVDHVIPLSRGGTHEMKNAQATHLLCNALKRDRGSGDQLALIG